MPKRQEPVKKARPAESSSRPGAAVAKDAHPAEEPIWPGLTVEVVLYAALVLAGAFIRFFDLGRWPLLTEEATQALAAWRYLHAQGVGPGAVPLLFDGALLGFFTLGAADAVARLLPATLGTALILLPLGLRRHLGSWGALAASFFLAFSPTLVFFSRTLAGPIPALAGIGAVLLAIEMAGQGAVERARVVGAAGLAVAVTSSPWVYTFFLAMLLFTGLGRAASRRGDPWPGWEAAKQTVRTLAGDRRTWGLAALLVGLISTALMLNWGGLQGTADLLGTWLGRLVPGSGGRWFGYPVGLVLFYEVSVLLLGLVGLVLGVRRRNLAAGFLGLWALLALALATLSGARDPEPLAFAILPLCLLSGVTVAEIAARLKPPLWPWVGSCLFVLSAVAGFWWLQLATYFNGDPGMAVRVNLTLVSVLVVATPLFLVAAALVFWHWVGRTETAWAVTLFVLGLLACLTLRSSVSLNLVHARDAREPMVVAPSSVDLRDLVAFLEDWSVRTERDQHALSIAVEKDLEPLIPWYLRDFPDLRLARSLPGNTGAGALVMAARPDRPQPAGYVGTRYRLRTLLAEDPLHPSAPTLSWWLLHQGGGKAQVEHLELWVKP